MSINGSIPQRKYFVGPTVKVSYGLIPEPETMKTNYKVFISHSMPPEDLGIVYAMAEQANHRGISTFVAERAPQLEESICKRNQAALKKSDSVVVFVTRGKYQGTLAKMVFTDVPDQWVHQEIGAARALHKTIIPIIEKGVPPTEFSIKKHVPFDRERPWESIQKATKFIESQKIRKEQSYLLALTVSSFIGGFLIHALLTNGKG